MKRGFHPREPRRALDLGGADYPSHAPEFHRYKRVFTQDKDFKYGSEQTHDMARLLPLRSEPEGPDAGARVLDIEDAETDEVFSALSSETARDIYRAISEEPAPPSDIAERVDSSIQNVRYHLENLEEADLVEVTDTWYSSRGNEMSVYAASSNALVLANDEQEASRLRTALSRLLGGVAVLAMASLAVQEAVTGLLGSPVDGGSEGGAGGAAVTDGGAPETEPEATDGGAAAPETTALGDDGGATAEPPGTEDVAIQQDTTVAEQTEIEVYAEPTSVDTTVTDNETTMETTTTAADAAASGGADAVGAGVPPGVLFFAGGTAVLVAVVGYWYWAGR